MRKLLIALAMLPLTTFASVQLFTTAGADLGHFADIRCGSGLTCSSSSGKGLISPIQGQVTASTATTITSAQCGSTFTSSASVAYTMPEASMVLGCRLTFVSTGSVLAADVADGTDKILILTATAGNKIQTAATAGNSVVLEAVGNDSWAPIGKEQGSWTDTGP